VEISNRKTTQNTPCPNESVLEDDVVNEFGHGSIARHYRPLQIQHRAKRYVNRPVYFKKYETGDPYGFYVVLKTNENEIRIEFKKTDTKTALWILLITHTTTGNRSHYRIH
jgi:hypothetical protein